MNPCKQCGSYNIVIHTETDFGHGDSTHRTYAECKGCGRSSFSYTGWNWWADEDLRKAQDDWNNQNPKI